MSSSLLGSWALIDIETTGLDPACDKIIDVGFLQFDNLKLVRKYSSLVQYEGELSHFIQRLTKITNQMVHRALPWSQVKQDVFDLEGHILIAHNSDFEKSFLQEEVAKVWANGNNYKLFQDSIYYLALLNPERSNLNLEGFITQWDIRACEMHRGFEDSLDLLKVMLVSTMKAKRNRPFARFLDDLFKSYPSEGFWFCRFWQLSERDLDELASQIEFDLEGKLTEIMKLQEKIPDGHIEINSETDLVVTDVEECDLSFSGNNIRHILRDENKIRTIFPRYNFRNSQEELAVKVGQAFHHNVHVMVQAPTGTGKTLGYLLTAILFSLQEEKQILISTGTKTLQSQIMQKDVPQVMRLLGLGPHKIKISYLVGSGNHLCELLFAQYFNRDEQDSQRSISGFENDQNDFERWFIQSYYKICFFYNREKSAQNCITADGIPYILKKKIRSLESEENNWCVDFRSCAGRQCPYFAYCSYQKGLQEAKDANIVIGNHALMFTWPKGFPRPLYVIVDEAHKIEGESTKAFSYQIDQKMMTSLHVSLVQLQGVGSLFYLLAQRSEDPNGVTSIISQIREQVLSQAQIMKEHLEILPDLIERFFKQRPRYTELYWNEAAMFKAEESGLSRTIRNHLESLYHVLSAIFELLSPYLTTFEMKDLNDDHQILALTRFEKWMSVLDDALKSFIKILKETEDYATSVRYHEGQGYELLSAPVNVGRILAEGLLNLSSSVVFTSATLGNAQGDQGTRGIEWATGYLYVAPERRFKSGFFLPAVYDYENKVKVYFCDDVPALGNCDFVVQTLRPVMQLIRELEGRSLLLYSAKTRFELARELLLEEFEAEIPIFLQGMGPQVVEEFKKSANGILLGMESFGEGIDIPGDTLQFIFIDKIPDMRQDFVINKRREFFNKEIGQEFTDYYLAHRTRALHQKLGRLLRTEHDFGGVIVVDSRLKSWKGSTMNKVISMMKPYKIERCTLQKACKELLEYIQKGQC